MAVGCRDASLRERWSLRTRQPACSKKTEKDRLLVGPSSEAKSSCEGGTSFKSKRVCDEMHRRMRRPRPGT